MAGTTQDSVREVVPRWRAFSESVRRGEISSLHAPRENAFSNEHVVRVRSDWERTHGQAVAGDFLSVAIVTGHTPLAAQAAREVLRDSTAPPLLHAIAMECVGAPLADIAVVLPQASSAPDDARKLIGAQRRMLREYGNDAVAWVNMALNYTLLGQRDSALRSLRAALGIAPRNRFVLRSAARCLLHWGDPVAAHDLLKRNSRTPSDPWLLAAEIAHAAAAGVTSRLVRQGREIVGAEAMHPRHLSELRSAIGTLEAHAGNRKGARKLLYRSLESPTENAIAQAAWIDRNIVALPESRKNTQALSPEAAAWAAYQAGEWGTAYAETQKWFLDQRFSSRPAVLGSFLATTILERHDDAIQWAKFGLRCNPNDVVLKNNGACALAQAGRVNEAAALLATVRAGDVSGTFAVTFHATRGLIHFRSGQHEQGRAAYLRAIQLAEAEDDWRALQARLILASEEIRASPSDGVADAKESLERARGSKNPVVRELAARLEAELARLSETRSTGGS